MHQQEVSHDQGAEGRGRPVPRVQDLSGHYGWQNLCHCRRRLHRRSKPQLLRGLQQKRQHAREHVREDVRLRECMRSAKGMGSERACHPLDSLLPYFT